MKNYSWLPNKFVDDGIGLIINGQRFEGSSLGKITRLRNLDIHLTDVSLVILNLTEEWNDWMKSSSIRFSAEEVYGPEGKLNWLWPLRWERPMDMLSAFCTNMGGGVPIEVIREIVDICYQEAIVV